VQGARDHLSAAGFSQVEVVQTDGALGYHDDGTYDRIILTVSSNDIAPAWREQLSPDRGRLVLPLGALLGASLMVGADLVARLLGEIPVGVVTAVIGAPFFLVLLRRARTGYEL